jgi:preprotein translocase subunit Sss1
METEVLENIEAITEKIEIVKEVEKKQKFYTNEEIILITTVAGIGIVLIVLMWVFGVSLAPAWTFFP